MSSGENNPILPSEEHQTAPIEESSEMARQRQAAQQRPTPIVTRASRRATTNPAQRARTAELERPGSHEAEGMF